MLRRVPPHAVESETGVSRNEICPRELWLLNGYAEYRRMCLSPKQMLVEMKSVSASLLPHVLPPNLLNNDTTFFQ